MAQPQKSIARTSSREVQVDTPKLPDRYADESYKLFSQVKVDPPTPEEAKRIRNKCIRWILPFLCVGYHLMYVDKQTVRTLFLVSPSPVDLICSLGALRSLVFLKTAT